MTKAMKVEGPLHVVCQCDKCKTESQEPQGVQVSPIQFIESTFGKGHFVGKPVIWAEWPSREKNT